MLLEIIILLLSALFIFNWWGHGYWKRRNVFSLPKVFLFGNFWELVMGQKVSLMFCDMYKKYKKQRLIGFYCFYKPMLFLSDPEMIKRILVMEFNSFSDNGFTVDKKLDPIWGVNPFTAPKSIAWWKELRGIQATNQTHLRLKEVVPSMSKIGEFMYDYIKNKKNQPVEVLDISTRAAVDSAVLHAFGIEPKSFTDPEFSFMKFATGDQLFSATFLTMISAFFFPIINTLLNLRITSKQTEDFFLSFTRTNIEHRKSANIIRSDLFDTIMKLNQKKIEQGHKGYTELEMSGHCASFYADATVTTAVVFSCILLELAKNQDIQEKLRKEIFSVGKKPEDFDYDKVHSITYLQMVFDETLRVHPPVTLLSRTCTKDTEVEGAKISKGTKIFVSPLALHYDKEYFPEPEKFDPERFSEANRESMTKYTFIPFGEGPRICVGMRYGNIFVKTSIAFILLKYKILPTNDLNKGIHYIDHFLLSPIANSAVKFEEI